LARLTLLRHELGRKQALELRDAIGHARRIQRAHNFE